MRPDRQMDKYAHEDRGRRPPDDFQRYPDKRTDRRFEHEPPPPRHEPPVIQRFEDKPPVRRMDRFPADERRRPDDRDFPPRDRPPSLERRVDHHVIRHDHGKPEWKPQRVDHRGGRGGEYRDVVDVRHSPNRGRRWVCDLQSCVLERIFRFRGLFALWVCFGRHSRATLRQCFHFAVALFLTSWLALFQLTAFRHVFYIIFNGKVCCYCEKWKQILCQCCLVLTSNPFCLCLENSRKCSRSAW